MLSVKNKLAAFALVLVCAFSSEQSFAQSASDQSGLAALAAGSPPPSLKKLEGIPAKKLFGGKKAPAQLAPRAYGSYAKGCLAGGAAIPVDGPAWQVMRLKRNRNWGHPSLIALLEDLAVNAKAYDGWNGLLVGDLSQPRGGPMLTGHASHQIGLDGDVWLTPMPDRTLTNKERENISARLVVKDRRNMDYDFWTEAHARLIKRAAKYDDVARIFVHPPIKAELCRWAKGDRSWLAKIRPYFGHNYHFHIRMNCPPGSTNCKNQAPSRPKDGTGCGEELAYWMGDVPWVPKKRDPTKPVKPVKPVPPLTLAGLPAECRAVIAAP